MTTPQVSIIIPVYNSEQYLNQCLDSVLTQTFEDFELLLIDDGSKDNSGKICDDYATRDSRIRVFHKSNGGVSSARNLGLENAVGEWIYFMDADDELFANSLEILISGIDDIVDVVMGAYVRSDTDHKFSAFDKSVVITNKEQSVSLLYASRNYQGYMCIRMFRSNIIKKENLRFDTTISIKEDTLFILQYLCKSSGNTKLFAEPIYYYRIHEDSAMRQAKNGWNPKYLTSFDALAKMFDLVKSNFSNNKLLVFAKQSLLERYREIYRKMRDTHTISVAVLFQLFCKCICKLGVGYFIKEEFCRVCRIIKRIL